MLRFLTAVGLTIVISLLIAQFDPVAATVLVPVTFILSFLFYGTVRRSRRAAVERREQEDVYSRLELQNRRHAQWRAEREQEEAQPAAPAEQVFIGEPRRDGQERLTATWSDDDAKLLQVYQLYQRLREPGYVQSLSAACPVSLGRGERCLFLTTGRVFTWQPVKQTFSQSLRNERAERHWTVVGEGPLVLTDRALILSAEGRDLRFTVSEMFSIETQTAPSEIAEGNSASGVSFEHHEPRYVAYWVGVPAADLSSLALMIRHERSGQKGDFRLPYGFVERARYLGYL